jgi:hypothetical protein
VQQRLWLAHQLNPESPAYNVPRGLRLKGKLQIAALERALNEIIRRHEVLRTTFPATDDLPVQRIAPELRLQLPMSDLRDIQADQRLGLARQLASEEFRLPFNLAAGPVLRAKLWRLANEDHVLLLTMHHIASDAWTGGVLLEELGTLYDAYLHDQPSPLPELSIQYADYAIWQRVFLSGDRLKEQLTYWRQHLESAPPLLALPTDQPRPKVATFAGALHSMNISGSLLEQVKQLSRNEGATSFMTLLGIFTILLSRHSGSEDIVVGTDLANRTQLETEKLIGCFVNLLPMRIHSCGDLSFRELLQHVKVVALATYAHQDFPFEKMVAEFGTDRTRSYAPIVQVLFVKQNIPGTGRRLTGLEISNFEIPITNSKFDLAVFVDETADHLACHWLYSSDLFNESTIIKLSRQFAQLVESAAANPDLRVRSLEMRTKEDYEQGETENNRRRQSQSKRLMLTNPASIKVQCS